MVKLRQAEQIIICPRYWNNFPKNSIVSDYNNLAPRDAILPENIKIGKTNIIQKNWKTGNFTSVTLSLTVYKSFLRAPKESISWDVAVNGKLG